ncbi:MAG: tryptophan--tRNA ligase [Thaumarchaeota archaeon]|nr:tryptophan--tRNA ligase [Nitrososphaerota archaeon]MDG6907305.1 tryptophan--tRNA ligase [Nitrososphaerota archaeon]
MEANSPASDAEFTVTPWSVVGNVDYDKLIERFGTSRISNEILKRFERITGELHPYLRRKIFYSHRDLDWILDKYEAGEHFFLYTGRGPSGGVHLGHLIPWIFTKYLQDKFGAELYFQMTDDEKFYNSDKLTLERTKELAMDNTLDLIAMGFDSKKTFVFTDTGYIKTLYPIAAGVAKHTTFNTAKAVFGFDNSTRIGMAFFPALQAAPCFLPSALKGYNIPCLIPAAIDQDPYWRGLAREVAPKLGYYKPAQIHSKFMPGLGQGGKMSASQPETAIFTTDSDSRVEKKILSSFTGGRSTVEEQRRLGGQPDICPVYQYYYFMFEPDDHELAEIHDDCESGRLLCGDCKMMLASRTRKYVGQLRDKREKAKEVLDDYIVEDSSGGLKKRSQAKP